MRCVVVLCAVWLAAVLPSSGTAQQQLEVDLELILMVDVSRSMSPGELEIQRLGYAAALQSDAVYAAVQSGLLQRVALSYVEWAGSQRVVVDWRLLESREDLAAFANTLTANFDPGLRRTSISSAIDYAVRSLDSNGFLGLRRVIDISGDGPNNLGRGVERARDDAVAQGVIINGLPLMTREGLGSDYWHLDDLDLYYAACVIGGPGAFVIPVHTWADFAQAVRRKLVLEMVSHPNQVVPVQFTQRPSVDCFIGEKLWEQRRRLWEGP